VWLCIGGSVWGGEEAIGREGELGDRTGEGKVEHLTSKKKILGPWETSGGSGGGNGD